MTSTSAWPSECRRGTCGYYSHGTAAGWTSHEGYHLAEAETAAAQQTWLDHWREHGCDDECPEAQRLEADCYRLERRIGA